MRHRKIISGCLGIMLAALWTPGGPWASLSVYADSDGACCIKEEATCPCVPSLDEETCAVLGGYFLGEGSTCDLQPGCDPCDRNANGECDADDVLPGQILIDYISLVGEPLPNAEGYGITDTIVIHEAGVIADLNVGVDITHTWVGDICVTLTNPAGESVTLIDRPGLPDPGPCDEYSCCGCSGDDYVWVILDDEGTGGSIEDLCINQPSSPPNYTPSNPLNPFNNRKMQGVWTMTVFDSGSYGDIGQFEGWSLHFVIDAPPSTGNTAEQTQSAKQEVNGER